MARLVIIDDDEHVLRVLERALRADGYEVTTATDGEQGLLEVERIHPEVVITDIFMPEREGLSTISEIRTIAPQARILAISGGGSGACGDFLSVARDLGACATLQKPFSIDVLRRTLRDALEASEEPETTG